MDKQVNLKTFIQNRENGAIVRSSCMRRLDEIISACDKIPIAKLMTIILRKKGELQNDPFNWGDKTFLKKLEQYQKEFSETYNPLTGEFDLNEDYE